MAERALIAMSGGVDSSAAAQLMLDAGYTCAGATMQLFSPEGRAADAVCGSPEDVRDAQAVAASLGIAHHVLDFSDRFGQAVMADFARAYATGATPNPCIRCNRFLKFGAMVEEMHAMGFDYVVTGHYARIVHDAGKGRYFLKKAVDASKDQSYVLYTLTQAQLRHVRFPLGEFTKAEIRAYAEAHGFCNARKKDSQDICFVPDGDYAGFIARFTGKTFAPGDFTDPEGRVLGQHRGIIHYTIGQRKGLGIAVGHPIYVCGIDPEENRVILGESEALFSDRLTAEDVNLITVDSLETPMRVRAKIRYRHTEQSATAWMEGGRLQVQFDEPQRAITRGQAVVLYDGDTVVGGGTIC